MILITLSVYVILLFAHFVSPKTKGILRPLKMPVKDIFFNL